MAHITIAAPGLASETSLEVEDGEIVIVGRDPVDGADVEPSRTATIPVPSVSSRHVRLSATKGSIRLEDLGSRNGTWLRLTEGSPVQIGDERPLHLRLGFDAPRVASPDDPAGARWTDSGDYHVGVREAVVRWLQESGVAASVTVHEGAPSGGNRPDNIPLANRRLLRIEPVETVDGSWPDVLGRIWRYCASQDARFEAEEATRREGLILASDSIRQAHRDVVEAAARGLRTLLIVGPSGSGKEGLARCYHRHSERSGAFVPRNCSMFNRELLKSELFGAEAGAFTGCIRRIIGAVERAQSGTLFLDEIGEMTPDVQPMLLRFLDRAEYERMGDSDSRTADVRIVAATNRDLRTAALGGEFRADLWYRLSIQVVEVPPLRERQADIVAFLRSRRAREGCSVFDVLSTGAREAVAEHAWEGNFRELMNFADRITRARGADTVDADACRAVLKQVSLSPTVASDRTSIAAGASDQDLTETARRAARAFEEDFGKSAPGTWDEVKDYLERYWKPCMFAHMGGVSHEASRDSVDAASLARRLDADRGTATKHISRFFERFTR
jgi:DNA-binding NtrC family response regulator